MSFTPIPVIANDKNKPECIFFFIESFFNVETAIKKKKRFYLKIIQFLTKLYVGNVYNQP